MQNIRSW